MDGLKGGENGAQTQDLAYNAANQVTGGTYDAAGNRLSDGTTTATDDALNRLVTQDGTSYQYNGDGVLLSDGTTTYTQDLAAPLAQILADGSATYVYGAGSERLRTRDGSWYLGGDALGSVRTTLDDAGTELATASYDPWGVPQGERKAQSGLSTKRKTGHPCSPYAHPFRAQTHHAQRCPVLRFALCASTLCSGMRRGVAHLQRETRLRAGRSLCCQHHAQPHSGGSSRPYGTRCSGVSDGT